MWWYNQFHCRGMNVLQEGYTKSQRDSSRLKRWTDASDQWCRKSCPIFHLSLRLNGPCQLPYPHQLFTCNSLFNFIKMQTDLEYMARFPESLYEPLIWDLEEALVQILAERLYRDVKLKKKIKKHDNKQCSESRFQHDRLCQDNVPSHTSILVKQFLKSEKINVTNLIYSPDLASCDFVFFQILKKCLSGRRHIIRRQPSAVPQHPIQESAYRGRFFERESKNKKKNLSFPEIQWHKR